MNHVLMGTTSTQHRGASLGRPVLISGVSTEEGRGHAAATRSSPVTPVPCGAEHTIEKRLGSCFRFKGDSNSGRYVMSIALSGPIFPNLIPTRCLPTSIPRTPARILQEWLRDWRRSLFMRDDSLPSSKLGLHDTILVRAWQC